MAVVQAEPSSMEVNKNQTTNQHSRSERTRMSLFWFMGILQESAFFLLPTKMQISSRFSTSSKFHRHDLQSGFLIVEHQPPIFMARNSSILRAPPQWAATTSLEGCCRGRQRSCVMAGSCLRETMGSETDEDGIAWNIFFSAPWWRIFFCESSMIQLQ